MLSLFIHHHRSCKLFKFVQKNLIYTEYFVFSLYVDFKRVNLRKNSRDFIEIHVIIMTIIRDVTGIRLGLLSLSINFYLNKKKSYF